MQESMEISVFPTCHADLLWQVNRYCSRRDLIDSEMLEYMHYCLQKLSIVIPKYASLCHKFCNSIHHFLNHKGTSFNFRELCIPKPLRPNRGQKGGSSGILTQDQFNFLSSTQFCTFISLLSNHAQVIESLVPVPEPIVNLDRDYLEQALVNELFLKLRQGYCLYKEMPIYPQTV